MGGTNITTSDLESKLTSIIKEFRSLYFDAYNALFLQAKDSINLQSNSVLLFLYENAQTELGLKKPHFYNSPKLIATHIGDNTATTGFGFKIQHPSSISEFEIKPYVYNSPKLIATYISNTATAGFGFKIQCPSSRIKSSSILSINSYVD